MVRTFVTGKTLGQWLLLAAFVTILYFCFRIMQPFLMPIFLALILSALLSPVYAVVTVRCSGQRIAPTKYKITKISTIVPTMPPPRGPHREYP